MRNSRMFLLVQDYRKTIYLEKEKLGILLAPDVNGETDKAKIIYTSPSSGCDSFSVVGVYRDEKRAKEVMVEIFQMDAAGKELYVMPKE